MKQVLEQVWEFWEKGFWYGDFGTKDVFLGQNGQVKMLGVDFEAVLGYYKKGRGVLEEFKDQVENGEPGEEEESEEGKIVRSIGNVLFEICTLQKPPDFKAVLERLMNAGNSGVQLVKWPKNIYSRSLAKLSKRLLQVDLKLLPSLFDVMKDPALSDNPEWISKLINDEDVKDSDVKLEKVKNGKEQVRTELKDWDEMYYILHKIRNEESKGTSIFGDAYLTLDLSSPWSKKFMTTIGNKWILPKDLQSLGFNCVESDNTYLKNLLEGSIVHKINSFEINEIPLNKYLYEKNERLDITEYIPSLMKIIPKVKNKISLKHFQLTTAQFWAIIQKAHKVKKLNF
jgi:hypothetical protein